MVESLMIKRRKLRIRSWRRGTREMDLMFGPFADKHLEFMDRATLGVFEKLLELPEPVVSTFLTGQTSNTHSAIDEKSQKMLRMIADFYRHNITEFGICVSGTRVSGTRV